MKKFRKVLLLGLSFVLVAALAVAATVAYFTSQDGEVNVMTVGNVKIELIEQQRDGNGGLEPFEQGKELMPIVGSAQGEKDEFGLPTAENYVDKIVTVKNTGKSDAYVRVLVAVPKAIDDNGALHWNLGDRFDSTAQGLYNENKRNDLPTLSYDLEAPITINGVAYNVYTFTYEEALAVGETTPAAAFVGFYLDKAVDYDGENYTMNGEVITGYDMSNGVVIPVYAQAVQVDGFANADEAFEAAGMPSNPWADATQDNVADDAALKDALQNADASTIIVNLTEDVTYDISSWQTFAMGGEKTDEVVINGNGHKITFNKKDGDWSNIVTNGAKLVINNAVIDDSGYGAEDGAWNTHAIRFNCEVELNNVTALSAISVGEDAVLNNVTISDDANYYALWISAAGQTIDINGLTVANPRGIKIDDQYVTSPEKVTLNVSDATFDTDEKAAIMVKSVAGADIKLENIDITAVIADSANAVWVDEDGAAYADLVTVTGGSKIVEP